MEIKTESFTQQISKLDSELFLIERHQKKITAAKTVDVFANYWNLFFGTFAEKQIQIARRGEEVSVVGRQAIFVPEFSIIEWIQQGPDLCWNAICSKSKLPEDLPKTAVLFSIEESEIPECKSDVINLLRKKSTEFISVDKIENDNIYSKKLKSWLDLDYKANVAIAEYAKKLGISPEVTTRYFKKTYGISPVAYRNKARLLETMVSLFIDGGSIIEKSLESGFQDVAHFNKLFRKETGTQPSKFKLVPAKDL